MDIREQVYEVVAKVLSDGEGHPISELFEELKSSLGLTESQTTGRLRQMVLKGMIDNFERGMYRLTSKSNNASDKLQRVLGDIRKLINGFDFTITEALSLTEKDEKVLEELQRIDSIVDNAISVYYEEECTDEV